MGCIHTGGERAICRPSGRWKSSNDSNSLLTEQPRLLTLQTHIFSSVLLLWFSRLVHWAWDQCTMHDKRLITFDLQPQTWKGISKMTDLNLCFASQGCVCVCPSHQESTQPHADTFMNTLNNTSPPNLNWFLVSPGNTTQAQGLTAF